MKNSNIIILVLVFLILIIANNSPVMFRDTLTALMTNIWIAFEPLVTGIINLAIVGGVIYFLFKFIFGSKGTKKSK